MRRPRASSWAKAGIQKDPIELYKRDGCWTADFCGVSFTSKNTKQFMVNDFLSPHAAVIRVLKEAEDYAKGIQSLVERARK
jgi:predicted adenine nucleotide alpha hydrolase (AANH) superfamily ATPase